MRRKIKYFFKVFFSLFLAAILYWVGTYLPVITGYGAEVLCSGIFISGREAAAIERDDLGSFPCFHIPRYTINYQDSTVTASILGMASKTAVFRKGLGATLINTMNENELRRQPITLPEPDTSQLENKTWPQGNRVSDTLLKGTDSLLLEKGVERAFHQTDSNASATRALLVVYNDQIIFEKYGKGLRLIPNKPAGQWPRVLPMQW